MDKKLGNLLIELESFGLENDKDKTDKSERMRNVTHETGEFLSFMATLTKAKNILEIGTSNGYSTLWLADSASKNGGKVTTIEFSSYKANLAKNNFEKANMNKWIELHEMDAGLFIKELPDHSVDLIFLYSDRKEYVEWWEDLHRILHPNGLMIVDNITSHYTELREFIELVSNDNGICSIKLPMESGLLLLAKN